MDVLTFNNDGIFREALCQSERFVGFDPWIVVDWCSLVLWHKITVQPRLTSALNILPILVSVEPYICSLLVRVPKRKRKKRRHTGNDDILVMRNKILNDAGGAINNVGVPPVYPRMLWFQCRGQQVIPSSGHNFSSRSLSFKPMSFLDTLTRTSSEILFHDQDTVEG